MFEGVRTKLETGWGVRWVGLRSMPQGGGGGVNGEAGTNCQLVWAKVNDSNKR